MGGSSGALAIAGGIGGAMIAGPGGYAAGAAIGAGLGGAVGGLIDGQPEYKDYGATGTAQESLAFQKDIWSKYTEPQLKELSKQTNLLDLRGQAVSDVEAGFAGAEGKLQTQYSQLGLEGSGAMAQSLADLARGKATAKAGARRGAEADLYSRRASLAGLAPSTTGGISSAYGGLSSAQSALASGKYQSEAAQKAQEMQFYSSLAGAGAYMYGAGQKAPAQK